MGRVFLDNYPWKEKNQLKHIQLYYLPNTILALHVLTQLVLPVTLHGSYHSHCYSAEDAVAQRVQVIQLSHGSARI